MMAAISSRLTAATTPEPAPAAAPAPTAPAAAPAPAPAAAPATAPATASPNALILFTKAPVRGKVKTRLAAHLGEDAALELYRCMLADVTAACENGDWDLLVFLRAPEPDQPLECPIGKTARIFAQKGETMGERMQNAFGQAFDLGYSRCAIIGGDCPELTHAEIEQGFFALRNADVAIGPAHDGGFYLLGMNQLNAAAFSLNAYGHAAVAQETMGELQESGLTCQLLPLRHDIDTQEDALALLQRAKSKPELGKLYTVAILEQLFDETVQ